MVQLHVSHLRRALTDAGDGAAAAIVTRPGDYALELDPGELDLLQFEQLVACGASREALALWRGPPLGDVAGEPFAASEIRRLEELRLDAAERAVDDDLAAGRHREALPDLERLTLEEPLRERLHAQLMLALYRSGRQADALAAFRRVRAGLMEEIGAEPGPELQRLHEAVLRQDAALLAHQSSAEWARAAVEQQLVADAGRASMERQGLRAAEDDLARTVAELQSDRERDEGPRDVVACPFKGLAPFGTEDADVFFGRERLVGEMVARLAGAPLMAIVGPSGSGKSSALRAGLLPALASGVLPGSDRRRQVLLRPGEHPAAALADATAGASSGWSSRSTSSRSSSPPVATRRSAQRSSAA
jgi:DNA-binding SARP family transcriptional activator